MKRLKIKKLIKWFVLGTVAFVFITALSAEFTSRPSFCPTCHYMEPFYESWKVSSHRNVECVKCHFPPGLAGTIRGKLEGLVQVVNYIARAYTRRKPWAEISDESCLQAGCHETRLLKGKVIYKGVVFDHGPHLKQMRRGKKLRCTSCHSQIVQGEHITVTETTCFLCHFKKDGDVDLKLYRKISNCKTCHHWESIPREERAKYRYDHTEVVRRNLNCRICHVNTVVGDGFVPKENCYSCHFDYQRLSQYNNTKLIHKVHITEHKVECIRCHLTIQHKVQKFTVTSEPECTTCHTGTHKEQLLLFTGKNLPGVKGTPSPMFEAGLNCASCHIFHETLKDKFAEVKIGKPGSCERCHGRGYAKLLKLWEESANAKLDSLKSIIAKIDTLIKGNSLNSKRARFYIKLARYTAHLIEVGKPVHNINYSNRIIAKSYEYLKRAIKFAKLDVKLPVFVVSVTVPSECANCHTGIEGVTRKVYGVKFSHGVHIGKNKLKCSVCHSNVRKHGELVAKLSDCRSCHHSRKRQETKYCVKCHNVAYAIYSGSYAGMSIPDAMNDAGIECVDCHVKDDRVVKPDETVCLDCHEDKYKKLALEWKSKIRSEVERLKRFAGRYPEFKSDILKHVRNIESEGAFGLHNYKLTLMLIRNLIRKVDLREARR